MLGAWLEDGHLCGLCGICWGCASAALMLRDQSVQGWGSYAAPSFVLITCVDDTPRTADVPAACHKKCLTGAGPESSYRWCFRTNILWVSRVNSQCEFPSTRLHAEFIA